MVKKLVLALYIVAFCIIPACSDSESDKPTLEAEVVVESFYDIHCEKILGCNQLTTYNLIMANTADCKEFLNKMEDAQSDGLDDIIAAVENGTITYNGESGYQCLEEMKVLDCNEFTRKEPDICNSVFTGTVENGGSCKLNEECVSTYCDISNACPGTCAQETLSGGSCNNSDQCEKGNDCVNGTCQIFTAALNAGDSCDPEENWCKIDLWCNPANNQCEARKNAGDTCMNEDDMECAYNYMCMENETSGTCVEITITDQEGADCDVRGGIMCSYTAGLTCSLDDLQNQNFTGTCQPFKNMGETCFDATNIVMTGCDGFNEMYCSIPPSFQEDGVCATLQNLGADCAELGECFSGVCEGGVCARDEEQCF